jgi:histone-lysine N-methyltransferase SETD3
MFLFTFRWAVSTVMTRQNRIPAASATAAAAAAAASDEFVTALIPLWDMCNHGSGQVMQLS